MNLWIKLDYKLIDRCKCNIAMFLNFENFENFEILKLKFDWKIDNNKIKFKSK